MSKKAERISSDILRELSKIMIIKRNENINEIDSYFLYKDYNNGTLQLNKEIKIIETKCKNNLLDGEK